MYLDECTLTQSPTAIPLEVKLPKLSGDAMGRHSMQSLPVLVLVLSDMRRPARRRLVDPALLARSSDQRRTWTSDDQPAVSNRRLPFEAPGSLREERVNGLRMTVHSRSDIFASGRHRERRPAYVHRTKYTFSYCHCASQEGNSLAFFFLERQ